MAGPDRKDGRDDGEPEAVDQKNAPEKDDDFAEMAARFSQRNWRKVVPPAGPSTDDGREEDSFSAGLLDPEMTGPDKTPEERAGATAFAERQWRRLRDGGFSVKEIRVLIEAGVLRLAPAVSLGVPEATRYTAEVLENSWRPKMDRRLGRFRKLLELRGRLEWIGTTPEDGEVAAAHKDMLACIGWMTSFHARDRPEPGPALADLLSVVDFIEYLLNGDGLRPDWELLHRMAATSGATGTDRRRAAIVGCIEASLALLYGPFEPEGSSILEWNPETAVMDHWESFEEPLPARTAGEVSPEEFAEHAFELRKELRGIEPLFGNLDLECLRNLLRRADPSKRTRALGAAYIAASAALHVGAFKDERANSESHEAASRAGATVFRNAAARSAKKPA